MGTNSERAMAPRAQAALPTLRARKSRGVTCPENLHQHRTFPQRLRRTLVGDARQACRSKVPLRIDTQCCGHNLWPLCLPGFHQTEETHAVEPPDGHAGSETRKDKRALGLLLAHQRDIAGVRIRCQWLAVSVISIVKDNEKVNAWKDAIGVAKPRPWIPEGGLFFGPLDEMATQVLIQGADPKKALDGVASKYKSEVVTDYSQE